MPVSPPASPPLLVVVTGLPATGKTTLARGEFLAIQQHVPFRPYVIECIADEKITWKRWQQRSASGERHPEHVDDRDPQKAEAFFHNIKRRPGQAGGVCRVIDTSDFQ